MMMPNDPNEIVRVRRKAGYGAVRLGFYAVEQEPLPECECHPMTAEAPLRAWHEGQELLMQRGVAEGYTDADGVQHLGRIDVEVVPATAKKADKAPIAPPETPAGT